jgi:small ligand-binding sensory domain FIST
VLVFLGGRLGRNIEAVAAELGRLELRAPIVVAAAAGVLTEQEEVEGDSAAALMVLRAGRASALVVTDTSPEEVGQALAESLREHSPRRLDAALLLLQPDGVGPHTLEPLQELPLGGRLLGAGGLAGTPVCAIQPDGRVEQGRAAALVLQGLSPPCIDASPACRLLMPLRPITETRGGMVVRVDGERALELLSTVGRELVDQPLIFVALSDDDDPPRSLVIRPVQGVDPVSGGLVVSDDVEVGQRMAFAVRDRDAARIGLESVTRRLEQEAAGAAPRFGLYLNCAGRGSGLYGASGVDTRILRGRFGDLPLIGMNSSFEIAPHRGRPTFQLYTGVMALFTKPS